MFIRRVILVTSLVVGLAALARAKDAYFEIPVRDLKLVEGQLPKLGDQSDWRHYGRSYAAMEPYAVLDGPGEAYFSGSGARGDVWPEASPASEIHICAPEGREIRGRLVIVNSDRSGMDLLRFVVPASASKPEAKVPFYQAKLNYYFVRAARDIPGGGLVPASSSADPI